jgi:hypothetical protein
MGAWSRICRYTFFAWHFAAMGDDSWDQVADDLAGVGLQGVPVCRHCGEPMWLDVSTSRHRCLDCEAAPLNASASSSTPVPDDDDDFASAHSTTPVHDEHCVVSDLVGAFGSLSVSVTHRTLRGALPPQEPARAAQSAQPSQSSQPPSARPPFRRFGFLPSRPWHHKPVTDAQRRYLHGLAKEYGMMRDERHELIDSISLRGEASAVISKFLIDLGKPF